MGRKKVDLTGQRFGKLVVLSEIADRDKHKHVKWLCVCDCGNRTTQAGVDLRKGSTTSCGCTRRRNIAGETFGQLTAIKDIGKTHWGSRVWECLCDCGRKTEHSLGSLIGGSATSCGCSRVKDITGMRSGKLVATRCVGQKNGMAIWECSCECGNKTKVTSGNMTSGNTRSCGCLSRGTNSHRYNPNRTDEERLRHRYELNGGNGNVWSNSIMTRDDYTCQICNKHGCKLNAHHLNGWNAFPEQRFDLDNGVTLCTDCHKEFHSQHGYGDNTREQFDEYAASKTLVLN